MKAVLALSVFLAVVALATADMYMHSPRGSNNRCDEATNNRNNANKLFNSQNNAAGGYPIAPKMFYYANSILMLEWTNQHGCGENSKLRCEVIWQYSCSTAYKDGTPDDPSGQTTTNTCTDTITAANQDNTDVGRHESLSYFEACNARNRNTNLFIADQSISSTANAQHTRQNPNGGTNGFECQEERDYYPYWHPTPFIDIAVLTSNVSRCSYYQSQSENVQGRNYCTNPAYNNEGDCVTNGGSWMLNPPHKQTYRLASIKKPDCQPAPWSRDNHLGSGDGGYMNHYNWSVPVFPSDDSQSCFLRVRYNISSFDYDPWNTDARSNGANSPVEDDPFLLVGDMPLRMAIDTTQFGRTFQDRSYTFEIKPKYTTGLGSDLWNLGVRGKRGNIAQVRNCMEYDFTPQNLQLAVGDHIHIQWTGSNFEPAGNAGEGTTGTDRSNFVQLVANDPSSNYPEPLESQTFFKNTESAYLMAHIDQTPAGGCLTMQELLALEGNGQNTDQNPRSCAKLNGKYDGYFNGGVFRMNRTGSTNYMSTRNNNFTNRSQKGHIRVRGFLFRAGWVLPTAIGVSAGAVVIAGSVYYLANKNGGSGFTGFRSVGSFGSRSKAGRPSHNSSSSSRSRSSGRSHGSHHSKTSKGSFGGSMI